MKNYIVDASVIIKWFSGYDENDLDNALTLRDQLLVKECSILVPDLLFYEIANALRYNSRFTEHDVKSALNSLIEMEFDVRTVESNMVEKAIEIAYAYKVSVYDSCYLALSQIEDKPFIIANYKFVERIKGFKRVIKSAQL